MVTFQVFIHSLNDWRPLLILWGSHICVSGTERAGFQCNESTAHLQCHTCGGMMPARQNADIPQFCNSLILYLLLSYVSFFFFFCVKNITLIWLWGLQDAFRTVNWWIFDVGQTLDAINVILSKEYQDVQLI